MTDSFTKDDAFMGAVLVAKGSDIILNKGYGKAVIEWNTPNSPDVKFRIGSMTKQFTAALVPGARRRQAFRGRPYSQIPA
jgi:CubicO group peptidase (beta-lactamase class C family)